MRGRVIPLSLSRRLVCDLMHFASAVPSIPVQRRMMISTLVESRRALSDRPSWPAIFAKALALVARDMPEFRRAYCRIPWPHLYEYPISVAAVTVERNDVGGQSVLFVRIKDPAALTLQDLTTRIRDGAHVPASGIRDLRRALRIAALPLPLRRLIWWIGLNVGRQRANYFGTFALSVSGSLGTDSLHPRSPLTITLNYGFIEADGRVGVRLVYDHRVLDGMTVSRGLRRLEAILNTTILDEVVARDRRGAHRTPAGDDASPPNVPTGR